MDYDTELPNMHLISIKYTFCFQLRLISSFCSVRILQREKLEQEKEGIYKTVNTDLLRFLQHKNIQVENLRHLAAATAAVSAPTALERVRSRWSEPCFTRATREHWNVTKTNSQLHRRSTFKTIKTTPQGWSCFIYIPWCIKFLQNSKC